MPRTSIIDDRQIATGRELIIAGTRAGMGIEVWSGSNWYYDMFAADGGVGDLAGSFISPVDGKHGLGNTTWVAGTGTFLRAPDYWSGLYPTGAFTDWFSYVVFENPYENRDWCTQLITLLLRGDAVQKDIGCIIRGDSEGADFIAGYIRVEADEETVSFGVDVYENGVLVDSQKGGSTTIEAIEYQNLQIRASQSEVSIFLNDVRYLVVPCTDYPDQDRFGVFYRASSSGSWGVYIPSWQFYAIDLHFLVRDVV